MAVKMYLRMVVSSTAIQKGASRHARPVLLATCSLNANVSGGRVHLDQRAATVQRAIGGQTFTPLITFAPDANLGKIGGDAMAVAHIHTSPQVDGNIGGDVNRHVSGCRLQIGAAALAARIDQAHGDSTRAGFPPR